MIEVQNVSMRFNLGIEKNNSLKQIAVDMFSKEARKNRKKGKDQNEFWALQDVSFSVKKGEVIGFVGSNGAGKSTLLKVVAGVMRPTKGRVLVGGNICPMIELGAGFDMDLNARENIYLNGAVMGYSKDFLDSKFQEIVDFSELHDFLDVPVRNFSSGMIARLAFSVATIVEPEILIVDEILSVGDLNFQQKSENKMRNLITGGTTVLYVSHSIESIKSLCDRVVWLEHGKVIEVGPTEDVCELYYKSQMEKHVKDNELGYGEQAINGRWYFFDEQTGEMKTGWHDFSTKKVYYGKDGAMLYGEQLIDGKWYYFDEQSGAMLKNIEKDGYYYGPDGSRR